MIWTLSFGMAPALSKADENPTNPSTATRAKLSGEINVEYPEVAMRNHWEGRVIVLAWIDESGEVKDMWISKSSGYRELDTAALRLS